MALVDDIQALQSRGNLSNDKILDLYKQFDPSKTDDINGLLKKGTDAGTVLHLLGQYDQSQAEQSRSILGAARQGVSDLAGGEASTARETLGDSDASQTLQAASNFTAQPGYRPAADSMGPASTWGQWARAIPYRVVEALPGVGQDLAAGELGATGGGMIGSVVPGVGTVLGGTVGAIGGFGASYLARNYGPDAEYNARARTGQAGATPDQSDKERALAQGAVGALLSRVGLSGAGGSAVQVGDSLAGSLAGQAIKGAATDAATSVASDAVHQSLVPGNQGLDTGSLLNSAATGAVQGVAARGVKAVSDINNASKFSDIDPTVGQRLAARLASEDVSSPSASFEAIGNLKRDLSTEIGQHAKDASSQIKALQTQSGYQDDTPLMVAQARADLAAGQPIDPTVLGTLSDRLGTHSEGQSLVDALSQHSALNQVVQAGTLDNASKTFGGGISGSPLVQQFIKPFGKTSLAESVAASAVPALLGHSFMPGLTAGAIGAQAGTYGAFAGIDRLMGNYNPLQAFTNRFATNTPPGSMTGNGLPSFRAQQAGNGAGGDISQGTASPGPIGSPQAGISPVQLPMPIRAPETPPTSPSGGLASNLNEPGPAAPPSASNRPSPQALLAIAALRSRMASTEPAPSPVLSISNDELTPTSPNLSPQETMRPQVANDNPNNPNVSAALSAAMALSRAKQAPEPTPSAQPNPMAMLAAAQLMGKGQGGQSQAGAAGPKGAQGKPRGEEQATISGETYHHDKASQHISVTEGDHTVTRPVAGIANVPRYADGISRNLKTRAAAFKAAKGEVTDPRDMRTLDQAHHNITQRSPSWSEGYSHIEAAVNSLHAGDAVKGRVLGHLSTPKFVSTWSSQNTH